MPTPVRGYTIKGCHIKAPTYTKCKRLIRNGFSGFAEGQVILKQADSIPSMTAQNVPFIPGIVIAVFAATGAGYFWYKAEEIKKRHDVQTYREIVAFLKGETLDEIAKVRESGKRSYQKFLYIVGSIILGILVSQIVWWILQTV